MNNKDFFNALLKAQGKLAVVGNAAGIILGVKMAATQDLAVALVGNGTQASMHVRQPKDEHTNVIIEITRCYSSSEKFPYVYDNTETWACAIPKEDIVNRFANCFSLNFG